MDRETIIKFIKQRAHHPMKTKELAHELGIRRPDYPAFREAIKALIAQGRLVRLKRNRIGIASEMNIVVGPIAMTRSGLGFVPREGDDDDIMIPASQTETALDGDTVMVRITGLRGERTAGTVIRIVERSGRNIVGVFHQGRDFDFVVPDSPRFPRDIYISRNDAAGAEDGEKVVVCMTHWDDPHLNPQGEIIERLGYPGDPQVDMLTVIRSHDLPQEFPDEVVQAAEQAAVMPPASELGRREDLTKHCIYTIDPADAKDHDDAVSVTRLGKGYRLGVHIADVSHFVQPGTVLDDEAFMRGNSVYLPGMVIPMIPELLSNDLCSLKPNRRRLAHSVEIDFDARGKMLRWRVFDSLIKSQARLSYEEVQGFFDGKKPSKRVARVADDLRLARELARLISKRRFARGSLDFDLPEAKVVINARGEVIELGSRVRLESHRLVEEFMLVANRAIAKEVFRKAQPMLYRVHERPDRERVNEFANMMTRLGLKFPVSDELKPIHFASFLKKVQNRPEVDFINELMLRSMQKAVYQRTNIGHFGLAFTHYAHFTSPIRRYPDLLVHRLLRKLRDGRYAPDFAKKVPAVIDNVGKHCSETERKAEAAERQAVKVKQVSFMARHVGDHFSGVISGVTNYGFFVRLDNLGAEGMVRMSAMDDDYYVYEEDQYRIVGKRTGRAYRMGDTVKVGVMKVDQAHNEIDLFLTETAPAGKGTSARTKKSPGRSKQRPSRRKRK